MKKRKGFLLGRGGEAGEPSGRNFRPSKEAKALGVRDIASAGGGRPVIFASRLRSQRRMVNIPRIEPRVFRRLPNCSATDTMAVIVSFHLPNIRGGIEMAYRRSWNV